MTRSRDSQRQKVYVAEWAAFDVGGPQWKTLDEVEAFLDRKIYKSAYLQRHYPALFVHAWPSGESWPHRIRLRPGQGARSARGNPDRWTITLPLWARKDWVVVHELAHLLQPYETPWHGREFCAVYLDLVRHVLGQDAHDRLRDEFKSQKVRYKAPVKRKPLTEEQRQVLRDRLADARKARTLAA